MSLPEATFVRLECAPPAENDDATTWVYFIHRCTAHKGQEGRARFLDALGPSGHSTSYNGDQHGEPCCRLFVPGPQWHAWQHRPEFVRLLQQTRAVEYKREAYVG